MPSFKFSNSDQGGAEAGLGAEETAAAQVLCGSPAEIKEMPVTRQEVLRIEIQIQLVL